MKKPMYGPHSRPYGEDINDLVEKGGEGSGKKGHTTPKEWHLEQAKSHVYRGRLHSNQFQKLYGTPEGQRHRNLWHHHDETAKEHFKAAGVKSEKERDNHARDAWFGGVKPAPSGRGFKEFPEKGKK